ncbi:hypothetical protein C8R46DRAFT_1217272 [Mycena filopes]|nr:hypothetical protein C8R46DRAFT_1217272 [Mycena filopes]
MREPYYILCGLVHPAIHYHYADDNPRALIPALDEHVLILDYDPHSDAPPTVQSISPSISVTGVRVEEAPGAAAEGDAARNDRMFIIDTTTSAQDRPMDASVGDRKPHSVLAQFKQRNAVLPSIPPLSDKRLDYGS